MKERSILFSSDMVRAILDGRKTRTRRVIKSQPTFENNRFYQRRKDMCWQDFSMKDFVQRCPHGVVGDLLWVREAFCYAKTSGYDARKDGGEFWHKATDSGECEGPYKSGRFMPKKAARIWLEITGIRVERVQDVSERDIDEEGAPFTPVFPHLPTLRENRYKWFMDLWNKLNAKRGYPWESNPWVWVIEFKHIERTEQ